MSCVRLQKAPTMFLGTMHGMPAELVVAETCKLFMQLPASWGITSAEDIVNFVQKMVSTFDQELMNLKLQQTQPLCDAKLSARTTETRVEFDASPEVLKVPRTESSLASEPSEHSVCHLGKSSMVLKAQAQSMFKSIEVDRRRQSFASTRLQQQSLKKERWKERAEQVRNILLVLLLMYQTFLIPLGMAFFKQDAADEPPIWVRGWFVALDHFLELIFWANIALHLLDPFGWYPNQFDLVKSREQYLRVWCWYDILAVFPLDLLAYAVDGNVAWFYSRYRMNRVLNFVHFGHWFSHCISAFAKNLNPSLVRLIWLFTLGVFYLHIIACTMHGLLSAVDVDSYRVFLDLKGLDGEDPVGDYLHALDWTIKMTVGYAARYPSTELETVVALFVAIMGFTIYSFTLGSVMTIVSEYDAPREALRTKLESVHDYLDYVQAPSALRREITSYYQQLWNLCHTLDTDGSALEDLPPELQQKITFTINYSLVSKVSMFQTVKDDQLFIADIVSILRPKVCLPQQYVVTSQTPVTEMYFVVRGELDAVDDDNNVVNTITEGSYFGELCLLYGIPTTHSIVANSLSHLYTLQQEDFDFLLEQYPNCLKEILGAALDNMAADPIDMDIDFDMEESCKPPHPGDLIKNGVLMGRNGRPVSPDPPHDEPSAAACALAESHRPSPAKVVVEPGARDSLNIPKRPDQSISIGKRHPNPGRSPRSPRSDTLGKSHFGAAALGKSFGANLLGKSIRPRDMLKDQDTADAMELLEDIRAEARALFVEHHGGGGGLQASLRPRDPPRDGLPHLRPSPPQPTFVDPIAVGNMSAVPQIVLGQSCMNLQVGPVRFSHPLSLTPFPRLLLPAPRPPSVPGLVLPASRPRTSCLLCARLLLCPPPPPPPPFFSCRTRSSCWGTVWGAASATTLS